MSTLHFVTVYVLWRCTLSDVYVLKTLRFGTLTFCAATFCNIMSCDVYFTLRYDVAKFFGEKITRFLTVFWFLTSCKHLPALPYVHSYLRKCVTLGAIKLRRRCRRSKVALNTFTEIGFLHLSLTYFSYLGTGTTVFPLPGSFPWSAGIRGTAHLVLARAVANTNVVFVYWTSQQLWNSAFLLSV